MKRIIFLLLGVLLLSEQYAQSIDLVARPYEISASNTQAIAKKLDAFTIGYLDADALLENAGADELTVNLQLPNVGLVMAKLRKVDLLSEQFQWRSQQADGLRMSDKLPDVYTFEGSIIGDTHGEIALTVAKGMLSGRLSYHNGNTYYMEPLHYHYKSAPAYTFVLYNNADVLEADDDRPCLAKFVEQEQPSKVERDTDGKRCSVKVLEVGLAYDYGMVEALGSQLAVIHHGMTLHQLVQTNYDDEFDTPVRLKLAALYTSNCDTCDPWPDTDDKDELFIAFCNWFNQNGFGPMEIDFGRIYTPRDFSGVPFATYTQPSGLCTYWRASLVSYYAPALCTQQKIDARALARSIGVSGSPSSGITSPGGVCSNYWHESSIAEMNNALPTKLCLGTCVAAPPTQPLVFSSIFTPTQVCYTFDNFCNAGFQVNTDDPNLLITTAGTTICMQSTVYLPRVARVFVSTVDYCGKPSELGVLWTVKIDQTHGLVMLPSADENEQDLLTTAQKLAATDTGSMLDGCEFTEGTAAFNFEDIYGWHKSVFCIGQDVYLDGTNSMHESRYYIDLWRRPSNSNGAFDWVSTLGWTINAEVGIVNLSEAFAQAGYVFELGYEYQVKLAIANPPCIGWTEVTHRFSMQCCPLYSNLINFDLDLNETLNNYSLSVDGYYGYNNTGTVHEWVVLSSPNQYGGPYTLEATLSNSGYEELELFNGVQSGLFYTVIHKLTTPCGTSCYGQQIYTSFNRGERPQQDDAGCEFCGLFECSLFDQACVAPGGITAVEADGGILLSWPHVPNATNYVVEITLDNPSCCSVGEPTSFQIFTSKNYVFISSDRYYFDCFSYRIDAICADETIRGVEHCFIYLRQAAQSVDIPRLAPDATHAVVQVYPNPVQDQAEVNFGKVFTGSYRIVHTSGQLLESGHIQEVERLQVDFSHWPAGMYWMVIEGDEETQQFKIIKR